MIKLKKFSVGIIALVSAISLTGSPLALPVQAQTTSSVQAQIAALLAQIAALQAQLSGTTACYTFTSNLTVGSTGAEARQLQVFLNSKGFLVASFGPGSPGNETSYFGPLTRSALARYQASVGIAPAVGYFGPITRAHVNGLACPTVPPVVTPPNTPPSTGGLQGGAGSVDNYSLVSGLSNEEVGESQEDVEVAGLEIEVDNSSDIRLTALRLVFDEGTAGSDFEDYADEVSIWLENEEVARVDADDFNDDNNWTSTVSLDNDAIIRRGNTAELIVAISALNNIDSADEGDTWTVDFRQIRFVDALGANISEDPDTTAVTFSFESFSSATNAQLKLTLNQDDDDINEARIIDVDDNNDTDDVELLSFTLEADGRSDLVIDEIPVLITTTEAAGSNFDDPDDVITRLSLWMGNTRLASEQLPTSDAANDSDTVVFDDLDLELDAGEEIELVVKADFVSTSDALDNGDTVRAQITATERDNMDVEDESGDNVTNRTGTASAEAHALYDEGISVELVSTSATRVTIADDPGESDQGQFQIVFRVRAFDGDMRVDRSCENEATNGSGDAGEGVVYTVSDASATVITCSLTASGSDSEDNANVFEVDQGTTRTFTLNVVVEGDSDFVRVALDSINWGTATNDTNANFYTFNLDEFETSQLFLNTR